MQKVLITGAQGFIGHHLVPKLLLAGYDVFALDQPGICPRFVDRHLPAGTPTWHKDVRNIEPSQIDDVDIIIHLAAQANVVLGIENPQLTESLNVSATKNLLQAAEIAGVEKFVFASSREVYGNPLNYPVAEDHPLNPFNLYGETKKQAEKLVQESWMDTAILRLTNVVGSGDLGRVVPLWQEALRQGQPLTVFDPQKVLDFVSVHDVCQAILATLQVSGTLEPINVGSGVATNLAQLAQALAEPYGVPVIIKDNRPGEVNGFQADISRLNQVLGITPQHPEEFIPQLFN